MREELVSVYLVEVSQEDYDEEMKRGSIKDFKDYVFDKVFFSKDFVEVTHSDEYYTIKDGIMKVNKEGYVLYLISTFDIFYTYVIHKALTIE